MKRKITRRAFLARGAAFAAGAAFPVVVPASALGRAGRRPPGDRITLGFIGVGGMGSGHLNGFLGMKEVQVLAVCDVDARRREAARKRVGTGCAAYRDFRSLLDRDDIDAVVIATPDHWHTLAALHACQAGKDIYCEKPLTLTIEEARALVRAVRRYDRVFQTGSQQRSSSEFRKACELVRSGRIGKVEQVYVHIGEGPESDWQANEPVPEWLDWDLWLGPAPYVPYNPLRHPYNFRWFYDYSGGKMTDWGAHHNDIAKWGLGKDRTGPVFVEGKAVFPTKGLFETAKTFSVTYTYATGERITCDSKGNGVRFEGSDGWVFVTRGVLRTFPEDLKDEPLGPGDVHLPRSPGHRRNWLECIRTRERPICDVEIGAGSVILCHLCNIALRTGRKLRWDPKRMIFPDDEEANRWIAKPYRAPWHL